MLLEIPAMPIPAPIFARTMPRAVKSPIVRGPIISSRVKSRMVPKSLILCTPREIRPRRPQEIRKPKPIPKVSEVEREMCLKMSNCEPNETEAIKPPAIIKILLKDSSSSVRLFVN